MRVTLALLNYSVAEARKPATDLGKIATAARVVARELRKFTWSFDGRAATESGAVPDVPSPRRIGDHQTDLSMLPL